MKTQTASAPATQIPDRARLSAFIPTLGENPPGLLDVLQACCAAANELANLCGYDALLAVPFSVDEVLKYLPLEIGSPTHPDFKRKYRLYEVIDALIELRSLSLITFGGLDLSFVCLHINLIMQLDHAN